MLPGDNIKQILYSAIEETGKENIRTDVTSNILASQNYIDILVRQCTSRLNSAQDIDVMVGILGEALLHFMLTISTLPSERNVELNDGLVLDVVIPSLPSLRRNPIKSVIIQVIKDRKTDLNKVKLLESLQPNLKNIWLISARPTSSADYTEYTIFPSEGTRKYSDIITDIDKFLDIEDKTFRIIP